ncbi:unnamed protein product [Chironomus riparius]|uniref:Uncharacterized protein n=1 Tax=Chironomus riparius TaxID=315576 RepID=A0A9N9S7S1_9DIPT|nr:unnamed protein product [Chironomus riparius]
MNSIKLTAVLAFISVVSAGAISYAKRSDKFNSELNFNQGSSWGEMEADSGLWNGDIKGDFHAYPKYKFEYGVNDPHTHDHKSQWEHRDGDVVKGEYTLDEADGTKRVVKYHADDKTGFTAHVERIGHASRAVSLAYGNGYGRF